MTIRVAIVDDHAIVRQGLRNLLTDMSMSVVGEANCGNEAVKLAQEHQPDVMLLDIRMKNSDGLTALPHIKSASPGTQVIILTTYSNPTYLSEAIRNGASGYLLKDSEPEDIVDAIHSAASHSYLFDPALLNLAVQSNNTSNDATPDADGAEIDREPNPLLEPISDREQEVLALMARGMSNAAIAEMLQVSVTTVKTHVSHILRKLNVNDRTQAVLVAMRHDLIQPRS
jgi:DNA-binding NarL/FixJ family response regulator